MKRRKNRNPSTEPTLLPAELVDNLTYLERATELSEDEILYNEAADLLADTGVRATINGDAVTVTKYAHPVTLTDNDRTFYARIAQYDNDPLANTRARIIFDESPSSKTITTDNAAALIFCDMDGGNTTLLAYNGITPITNNEKYRELTRHIIEDIAKQHDDEQQRILTERRHRRRRALGRVSVGVGTILLGGAMVIGVHTTDDKVGPEQETNTPSEAHEPENDVIFEPNVDTPGIDIQNGKCGGGGTLNADGMWCDYDLWPDGSFMHIEHINVLGFQAQNVFRACPALDGRPIPTDNDPATHC